MYLLFLLQSVSTYLFSYPLLMLEADQRMYLRTLVDSLTRLTIYVLQLLSLLLWRSYMITLSVAIVVTILQNIVFSGWVRRQYA